MQEYIVTGKTVEEAIEAACTTLGLERDKLDVEVLEVPSRGFFGFGTSLAKVKVMYNVPQPDPSCKAVDFVENLLEKLGVQGCEVKSEKTDDGLCITVEGGDLGVAIGRRGETMDAIQYLASLVANRGEEGYTRVLLDIENYRAKRVKALESLARRLAKNVLKTRRNVTLEPMQAYERRIIHSTLQQVDGVSTHSVGTEPHRKVVITYEGGEGASKSSRPNQS